MPVSEVLSRDPAAARTVSSIWKLSETSMCTLIAHFLRQDQFWAAEMVLKSYFLEDFGTITQCSLSYLQIQETWTSIRWFVQEHRPQGEESRVQGEEPRPQVEEQKLWAKVSILTTFCEGILQTFRRGLPSSCQEAERLGVACGWSFSQAISLLRDLVRQALQREKKAEWVLSRTYIRTQLLEVDKDVAEATERGDVSWNRKLFDKMYWLSQDSEDNDDPMMVSSIHWRIRTLGYTGGRKAKANPSLIPLEVYAQRERNLAELRKCCSREPGGGHEWWPAPSKPTVKVVREEHSQKNAATGKTVASDDDVLVLLSNERDANRALQQGVQELRHSIAELISARDVNHDTGIPSKRKAVMFWESERKVNREMRQELRRLERFAESIAYSDVNLEVLDPVSARTSEDLSHSSYPKTKQLDGSSPLDFLRPNQAQRRRRLGDSI